LPEDGFPEGDGGERREVVAEHPHAMAAVCVLRRACFLRLLSLLVLGWLFFSRTSSRSFFFCWFDVSCRIIIIITYSSLSLAKPPSLSTHVCKLYVCAIVVFWTDPVRQGRCNFVYVVKSCLVFSFSVWIFSLQGRYDNSWHFCLIGSASLPWYYSPLDVFPL
jgi:hypothetical protein